MNVLSLFDGMACGMIAFRQAGIPIENYYAYEIDKYAVETTLHNFPEIQELGDVFSADFMQYSGIDWLIGGSPCFTSGHLVLTDKGYKDISDIVIGDMVLTHNGRYKPVVRTNKRKSKLCEVRAMGYPVFTTTTEHPFYTLERRKATYDEYKQTNSWRVFDTKPKWVKAKKLTKNHFVGMHINETENKSSLDTETAYILGRYVADGHLRMTKRKNRMDSFQYQVILSIGSKKLKQFKEHIKFHHFTCYPHGDSVYRCIFNSMELLKFIKDNGFGEGAVNKNIPELIFKQSPKVKEAFLMGYIEGDGCYVENECKYSMTTVSPRLAFGLQRLITSLWQTNVSVSVNSNDRKHKIGDREIKANYPLYTICAKRGMRKQTVAHIQNNIMWTQVRDVTQTEREEIVYNIEVAEDNSYTVNNCIVHNCTYWSIAQTTDKRETTASGLGWELFSQYLRALNEAKPKFFIYENNKSMSREIYQSISDTFGFEPILINSALVSAQNRQRYYWVGKRDLNGKYSKVNITYPEDRGILLKDVLDSMTDRDKSRAIIGSIGRTTTREYFGRWNFCQRPYEDDKSKCLVANVSKGVPYNVVAQPVQLGSMPRPNGELSKSQGFRIYDINGKSVTLKGNSGGAGGKTGLYAIPIEYDNEIPVKAQSCVDNKIYNVYRVCGGFITVKGKEYPIKLKDGYYIIRKLTVSECKKLQTVPDWYEFPVSDTQSYKLLGNGWTIEVIKHIILSILAE